jgi:hypothetical protein
MTYLPNKLNEYDTYTYNLRLYMVHPSELSRLDGAIGGRSVLIADNARVAKYNINNLEQIFTVGHNVVREGFGNRFTMTMVEPNGVTLLSTLVGASRKIGIQNHLHAGYLLAIDFHGRMPDGKPRKFNQSFYYPVVIKSLDFKVDEGGATYNIEMVENSSTGYRYLNNVIKEQITVIAETVGEFVTEFEKSYNQSITNAWIANPTTGALRDVYKFEFDESTTAWKDWRFQVLDNPFEASGTNFSTGPGDNPKLQVTANNGSNITTIIGQVLQLTAEYKCILTTQGGAGGGSSGLRNTPDEPTSKTLDSFPTFFKMITNVEYGAFDVLKGDYQKTITYKLKAYVVTDEIIDAVAYQSSITNAGVQGRRVANLLANGFMRKRYDYYYTGKNTEVLEFDLKFDYAYYYVVPYGDGYFGDPEVQNPQLIKDTPEVIARLKEITAAREGLASASKQLETAQASPGQGSLGIKNAFINFDLSLSNFNNVVSSNTKFLQDTYELSPGDINYHLRFVQDVVSDQDMLTSDNDQRSGNLKFGAVKMNLENAADLVKIELGIRGDPYWMGVPNSLLNAQKNVDDVADYEAGSVNFFLNVNLPQSDEDANGRRKPNPDYQITGVYAVRNVINRFANGQFTQYLSAVRDLATNASTAYASLAGDNSVATATSTAGVKGPTFNVAQAQEDTYRRTGTAVPVNNGRVGPQ